MNAPMPITREQVEYERALAIDLLEATHLTFWEVLRRAVSRYPDRAAISMGSTTWTYRELFDRSLQAAENLAELGVTKGTRVVLFIHTCPEWAVLHYALARLGAVVVPVNLAFEAAEIRHVLTVSQPELIITIDQFRGVKFTDKLAKVDPALQRGPVEVAGLPALRRVLVLTLDDRERLRTDASDHDLVYGELEAATREPAMSDRGVTQGSDPAYIIFTSGSTGLPKAALCASRAFLGSAVGFIHGLQVTPDDRHLGLLPAFHTAGVTCNLTVPAMTGGCADLIGGFSPSLALQTIATARSTLTTAFDTMWNKMMQAPEFETTDITSMRKAVLPATPSYIERLQEIWKFDIYVSTYGSTESGTLGSIVPSWVQGDRRRTTNGMPLLGIDFTVRDPDTGEPCPPNTPGEICFRGWCRVLEYAGSPEETAAAIDDEGYFHSGDYGYLDENGFLHYRGRYKMMIKTGGENVAEREVEIFLEQELDVVKFAQVVGVPDPEWGEAVIAFVELSEEVGSDQLRAMAVGKIARFKIPKQFIRLAGDEFPVLANGRPDKNALRKIAADLR